MNPAGIAVSSTASRTICVGQFINDAMMNVSRG